MRDSFWTLLGLQGSLGGQAEQHVMQLFNSNVIQSGASAGTVPTYIAPPDQPRRPGLGVPGSSGLISWDTGRQLAVDPTSHEYTLTNPFVPSAPVSDQTPMSTPAYRQGYGWNAAFNAFAPTTGKPVG